MGLWKDEHKKVYKFQQTWNMEVYKINFQKISNFVCRKKEGRIFRNKYKYGKKVNTAWNSYAKWEKEMISLWHPVFELFHIILVLMENKRKALQDQYINIYDTKERYVKGYLCTNAFVRITDCETILSIWLLGAARKEALVIVVLEEESWLMPAQSDDKRMT